jgi:EAL domain-containing protein (putative c-di-GMP-specific phosphodiesterase class I)
MSGIAEILAREQVYSVFQPIVDLDSDAVVAYEALVRGPVGDLQRPDALFAAAAAAGRLQDLDELCQFTALRGAISTGIFAPLTLFINVEPEVVEPARLDRLLAIAEQSPGRLQLMLEITERALAVRPADLLATVQRLRTAGWRIALDDVGSDDLSLAFMPLLQPDVIKLDMALV